jgi:hypothetical protein
VSVSLWLWFAFPRWLVMFCVSSCARWPFVYLPWRTVLSTLSHFELGCWVLGAPYLFWILIPYLMCNWKYLLFWDHVFIFTPLEVYFNAQKFLSLIEPHLFFFLVLYPRNHWQIWVVKGLPCVSL